MRGMLYVYLHVFFGRTDTGDEMAGANEIEEAVYNGLGLVEHLAIHLTACILGTHQISFALTNECICFNYIWIRCCWIRRCTLSLCSEVHQELTYGRMEIKL